MKKLISVVIVVALLMCVVQCDSVYARGGHGGGRGRHGGYGFGGAALGGMLVGAALVAAMQPRYEVVYMSGNPVPYYMYNGVYYQRDIYGNYYACQPVIVQPQPVIVQQAPQVIYVQQPAQQK